MTFKDGSKVSPSAIQKVLDAKYEVKEVGIDISGELSRSPKPEEPGLWFEPASGDRIALVNRPAKDDQDKPEDVVAKLDEALKAGKTTAKVKGILVEKDGKLSIQLAGAEIAEKK